MQRVGQYALIVDDLRFRVDSANMEVQTEWEGPGRWRSRTAGGEACIESGATRFEIHASDPVEITLDRGRATTVWTGATRSGGERAFFSLIAGEGTEGAPIRCARIGDRAAALGLPEPAVAVAGSYKGIEGDLVVLASDRLFGLGIEEAAVGETLLSSDVPIDVDWDFQTGAIELVAGAETTVQAAFVEADDVLLDGSPLSFETAADSLIAFRVPEGRHFLTQARPATDVISGTVGDLTTLLSEA
ncbi:MAG: hypothetical protein QGI83_24775 [Candidatus Latescibacteria bacterium]|nr:hypothetical protein [Candidatus Latescibacterota bacterium]